MAIKQVLELAARIPTRQLQIASYAALLCLAAVTGVGMMKSFSRLQAAIAERTQHEQTVSLSASLWQLHAELSAGLKALPGQGKAQPAADQINQSVVEAIAQFNRLSKQHGVALNSVSPRTPGKLMQYQEIPFDLEVVGGYREVMAWLIDAEQSIPSLAVNTFEVMPTDKAGAVMMKARLPIYIESIEK